MGKEGIRKFSRLSVVNTDDNGYVEFRAPKTLHLKTAQENDRLLSISSDGFALHLDPRTKSEKMMEGLRKRLINRGEPLLAGSVQ